MGCMIQNLRADPKSEIDYSLVVKKYQQYYIPPEIIEKIFNKRAILRVTNAYVRAPLFVVTHFFDDAVRGCIIANRITGETLEAKLIKNQYDSNKKCYYGYDGISTEALVYPLIENSYKGHYSYFSEATYRKGAKIRGYFLLDLRMRQVNDVTEIRSEAFFQLADPLVSAFTFALRGNRTFEVWINRVIDDTIGFLNYVGRKTVEGYFLEQKRQEKISWDPQ